MSLGNFSDSRFNSSVDWLIDKQLEAADRSFEEMQENRINAERSVTVDQLLEAVAEKFTPAQNEAFMNALDGGEKKDVFLIYCLLFQVRTEIVNKILSEENHGTAI